MPSKRRSDDLEAMRPTERFADRAADYRRYRPTYPPAAIDAVLEGLGEPTRVRAADVGAGTGIFARLLAERGVGVVAVEPNAAMREAAEPHPRVAWREARAEATGLEPGAVDLVTCAQAFHWFRPAQALDESHRILAARGRIALVWNERDEGDAATAAYGAAIRAASVGDPAERRRFAPEPLYESRRFHDARVVEARLVQRLDADGLVGRATSASYVPKEGPAYARLLVALGRIHERFAGADGLVSIAYRTTVHRATRADG